MDAFISKMLGSRGTEAVPPGPNGFEALELQLNFLRDPAQTLHGVFDEYGRVARFHIGLTESYLILEPELMEEVLLGKWESFEKNKDLLTRELGDLVGEGLLISEGEMWRKHRKLMAPALQRRQIAHYADLMVTQTEELLEDWEDGERRRFDRDVMEVTLRAVVQTLFDLDLEHRIERVAGALDDAMDYMHGISHSLWRFAAELIPAPGRGDYEDAIEQLDAIVYDLIESRRDRGEPGDDLLYQLIAATDDDGNQMTDQQLRDQVITLFLAGHETTALAITYAWHLLANHPERAERLYSEVDDVLGDGRAGAADVRELEFVEAVFKESMRLYPPAWIIGRQTVEEVEIGDWTIPRGAQVLLPQCVAHRNSEWFDEPDEFRPERWLGDLEDELPRFAYFPFGGGPRICIGNHFAKMEAVLIIATMAQHFELESVAPETLETENAVTQRPADPIEMIVHARD